MFLPYMIFIHFSSAAKDVKMLSVTPTDAGHRVPEKNQECHPISRLQTWQQKRYGPECDKVFGRKTWPHTNSVQVCGRKTWSHANSLYMTCASFSWRSTHASAHPQGSWCWAAAAA